MKTVAPEVTTVNSNVFILRKTSEARSLGPKACPAARHDPAEDLPPVKGKGAEKGSREEPVRVEKDIAPTFRKESANEEKTAGSLTYQQRQPRRWTEPMLRGTQSLMTKSESLKSRGYPQRVLAHP